MIRRLLLVLTAMALALPARAQLVPFPEGELILDAVDFNASRSLNRVDPLTGNGSILLAPIGGYGGSGVMAYDSYRGGLLLSAVLPPDSLACVPNCQRLWLVDGAGNVTSLGLAGVPVRALAPAGDGRVYFQRIVAGGESAIEYLDANGAQHVLMDQSGTAPFALPLLDLRYVPSQQALIATTAHGDPNGCAGASSWVSVHRIPLSADGSKLAGAVTCAEWEAFQGDAPRGLDDLPGGQLLLATNHGYGQDVDKILVAVDPSGPSLSTWATPNYPGAGNQDGAAWSPLLGKTFVLDDANNLLRLYAAGQGGAGTVFPTNVPVSPNTTGIGAGQNIIDVHKSGPGCEGYFHAYGAGLAGSGGAVPLLGADGCPDIGHGFTLHLDGIVGGAHGALFVGLSAASTPFKGGTLLVGALVLQVPLVVGGTPGQSNAGSLSLPAAMPNDPLLHGVSLYLQSAWQDGTAVKGVSQSNGLQLAIG